MRKKQQKKDSTIVLKLYVVDAAGRSKLLISNLQKLFHETIAEKWTLEVVDVLKDPHLAEKDRIIAVPTLIREYPAPSVRCIGDFTNRERLLIGLDIVPRSKD